MMGSKGGVRMFIADLHIHSKYSRATSRELVPEMLEWWARRKGIQVVGTGDFTHPAWREELREKLVPAEDGLYVLKDEYRRKDDLPAGGGAPVRFLVTGEISSIYKWGDRVRKVHNLILLPGLDEAEALARRLELVGNLHSDGRPILGLDSRDLLEITLDVCPQAVFIPAHIWTPHFSLFGAYSGFDRIEDCFRDMTPYIHALETGLSSDPPMNWRLSALDRYTLVSHSDAHSPKNLGREADLFNTALSYTAIKHALEHKEAGGFAGTLEFFPEDGKYHADGHRPCGVCLTPAQTEQAGGKCPVCGGRITVGVWNRAAQLADRPEGFVPEGAAPFESLVPLSEVIAASTGASAAGKKTAVQYEALLARLGPEFTILRETPLEEVEREAGPLIAEGIRRLREKRVEVSPGYDGVYGKVTILRQADIDRLSGQTRLFAEGPRPRRTGETAALARQKQKAGAEIAAETAPAAAENHGLNAEQWAAVTAEERTVAVIAGPGTGKTRTLTERIAYQIEQGTPPGRITAVTFTNRAARQMRDRLQKRLGRKRQAGQVHIGTFHALCLQLLEKWRGPVTLLDEAQAIALADTVCRELPWDGSPRDLVQGVSRRKNGLDTAVPEEMLAAYAARQQKTGALDFDDLLLETLRELEAGRTLPDWFGQLLVDEFQDGNALQHRLTEAWSRNGDSLFVIGDPDQAIYGFRGVDSHGFERLAADRPDLRTIRLVRNYRSTPQILRCALPVLAGDGRERALEPTCPDGRRVGLVTAEDDFAEALYIVKEINGMVGGIDMLDIQAVAAHRRRRGTRGLSDIAVLYRTHRQAERLEYCLQKEGIPYTVAGREGYLDDAAVRRALAFFRFVLQPADVWSLRVWLAGKEAVVQAYAQGDKQAEACARLLEAQEPQAAQLLRQYAPDAAQADPVSLLQGWITGSGLEETPALERLLGAASLCADMPALLHNLTLGQEADAVRRGGKTYAPDAVSLLTLHASKGLEFPVVFLCGVQKGLLPLQRPGSAADAQEERRLFYVGMTRAKEELILSGSGEPSPFLPALPAADLEREELRPVGPTGKQLSLFDGL